jgi:DNA-binding SARP family transcriptional activator
MLDGFALGSDTFDAWLDTSRREHAALVAKALQRAALRWLADGDLEAATAAAERLIALDRCAEAAYACLIAARAAAGDTAGVESAYFACADALRDEYGVKPSKGLERGYADAVAAARSAAEPEFAALLARVMARDARTPDGRRRATISEPAPAPPCP